jgi:phosphate/phosphite/phosphonate ABC transporter binding protein
VRTDRALAALPGPWLALPVLCLFLVAGQAAADEPLQLTFGVYTSDKPTDMYRMFKPILVHLEGVMTKDLARPVKIKLRVFNSYDAARKALVSEEVDFVRFGPSSYILAKDENPGVVLLAIEEQEGQFAFKGVIFARNDSGIDRIEDLRGKSFAFGDPDSTIGRYLSQAYLVNKGIYAKDLLKYQYLDRHDRVVAAVLGGDFDAGAAKESTFNKFRDQSPGLKALETFDNVTKPWVARSKLEPRLCEVVRKALFALKDKKVLDAMGEKITGFVEAKDEMYKEVRIGMEKSSEFLKGPPPAGAKEATRE